MSYISNVSFSLPLRSDNEFVLIGTEQNGITEKFMPIRSEVLAMSPSVCHSAPLQCSCLFLYVNEHPFTEFILNGTERQYRKNYAHRKWAISNVSFSLPLRSDNEFVLIGTELNGITEKLSIQILAMSPSVCRSAPLQCSCLFLYVNENVFHWIHQYILHCFLVFTVTTHRMECLSLDSKP